MWPWTLRSQLPGDGGRAERGFPGSFVLLSFLTRLVAATSVTCPLELLTFSWICILLEALGYTYLAASKASLRLHEDPNSVVRAGQRIKIHPAFGLYLGYIS